MGRRTWLSITVELIEGRGERLWPRPGRVFAVAKQHRFSVLATAIDDAFARWDRAHLHEFHPYPDQATARDRPIRIAQPDDWDLDDAPVIPIATATVGAHVRLGQQFVYVFDLGDDWTHLCTVADQPIDPYDTVGLAASDMPGPLPYFGWGSIPDQYGRRYNGDGALTGDLTGPVPPDPNRRDLPPWRAWWGPDHDYPDLEPPR